MRGLSPIRHFWQASTGQGLVRLCLAGWLVLVLSGCGRLATPELPTPYPTEYLPTVIAQTAQAYPTQTAPPVPSNTPVPSATPSPVNTGATPTPAASATPLLDSGITVQPETPTPTETTTDPGELPNAKIEIRNLGPLSRVVSPLPIYAYLQPGAGSKVKIELLGEDNRLLARQIKTFTSLPPGAWAVLITELDFEIAATAESARLRLSVADEQGRITELNSVPLILLSFGEADIIPPANVKAPIIIAQPTRRTLIQGGKAVVRGLARLETGQPLLVQFIDPSGAQVGMRLAAVETLEGSAYGTFAVEVPYNVSKYAEALLVVSEGSEAEYIKHLTSVEVRLSP